MKQMSIYRILAAAAAYTFFSVHATFSKKDQMLGQKYKSQCGGPCLESQQGKSGNCHIFTFTEACLGCAGETLSRTKRATTEWNCNFRKETTQGKQLTLKWPWRQKENLETNDNTSEVILSPCNKYMHKMDKIKVKSEIKLKPQRMCKRSAGSLKG